MGGGDIFNLPYTFWDFRTMDKDKYFYDYVVNALTRGGEDIPRQMALPAAVPAECARGIYSAIALDDRKAVNFYGFNDRESDLKDLWCCGGGVTLESTVRFVQSLYQRSDVTNVEVYTASTRDGADNQAAISMIIAMSLSGISSSYSAARDVLEQLQNCPFRCRLGSLSLTTSTADGQSRDLDAVLTNGPVRVSLIVTSFENAR